MDDHVVGEPLVKGSSHARGDPFTSTIFMDLNVAHPDLLAPSVGTLDHTARHPSHDHSVVDCTDVVTDPAPNDGLVLDAHWAQTEVTIRP